jgi:cell division protease FtsH
MAQRPPPRPPAPNWPGISKNLALWLLVVLLAVALFQFMGRKAGGAVDITYDEFYRQLDAGNIAKVEIYEGKEIHGELRVPVVRPTETVREFTTEVLFPQGNTGDLEKRLLDAGIQVKARKARSGLMTLLIAALPWIVIFGLWFFFLRQMQAGGNRAFSFGKSKAKLLSGDTPKITFADVAGADEAKVELQEIIEFL